MTHTAPLELEDGDSTAFAPVAKLRYSADGRAKLRDQGRKFSKRYAHRVDGYSNFIAWDGEGITGPDGRHRFILWGNSAGVTLRGYDLGTKQCLDIMLRTAQVAPGCIHVIYAGGYDINMMLKDVPAKHVQHLWDTGVSRWEGYRLQYMKGKIFRVTKDNVTCTLFDVFTFFACSFVKACRQYLGDLPVIDNVEAMKKCRGTFDDDMSADIERYWQQELTLLVNLADTLRVYFQSAGFNLSQWYGPGALANVVLKKHSVQDHKQVPPPDVMAASQRAYFGGRFERFQIGHHPGKVWQYDINSAYPWAIAQLPSLYGGSWHHVTNNPRHPLTGISDFAMYHIIYRANDDHRHPQPFPWRGERSEVFFPPMSHGWYWGPEVKLALKLYPGAVTIEEAWVFQSAEGADPQPFGFVREYYARRQQWKDSDNPAQLALKLALNSLYGKMAQKSGWERRNGAPMWHQLEWAGWVTSKVRATLLAAMMQAPDSVIACETDALFTTQPLNLLCNDGLGNWSATEYEDITYLQSGIYYATKTDGTAVVSKYRGIDASSLPRERVLEWLSHARTARTIAKMPKLTTTLTRFKTMGTSLKKPEWRTWVTEQREVNPFKDGKRGHIGEDRCPTCATKTPANKAMHYTFPRMPQGWREARWWTEEAPDHDHVTFVPPDSHPHILPWRPVEDNTEAWWLDSDDYDLTPDEV